MERNKHTEITNKLIKNPTNIAMVSRDQNTEICSTDVNKHGIENVVNATKYIYR